MWAKRRITLSLASLAGRFFFAEICVYYGERGVVIIFVQAHRPSAYALKYKHWENNATLRTLGVLYSVLVVEGQGARPRASGIRKQVWVCSADAGVCHAWKAAGAPIRVSRAR